MPDLSPLLMLIGIAGIMAIAYAFTSINVIGRNARLISMSIVMALLIFVANHLFSTGRLPSPFDRLVPPITLPQIRRPGTLMPTIAPTVEPTIVPTVVPTVVPASPTPSTLLPPPTNPSIAPVSPSPTASPTVGNAAVGWQEVPRFAAYWWVLQQSQGNQPVPASPNPVPIPVSPTPTVPIQPIPVQPSPIQPSPVQPSPIQPSPVQPSPIQPSPVQPAPIQPSPQPSFTPSISPPVTPTPNKPSIPALW